MFRSTLLSLIALGTFATAAALPASAQPIVGSVSTEFRVGRTPVSLSIGNAPGVYPQPVVYAEPEVVPVYQPGVVIVERPHRWGWDHRVERRVADRRWHR